MQHVQLHLTQTSELNRHIYTHTQFSTKKKARELFIARNEHIFHTGILFFLLLKHKTQHEIKMNPIYLHIPGLTLIDFLVQMFILSIFYQNVNN